MKLPAWLSGRFGDPDATHTLRARRPSRARPLAGALVVVVVLGLLGMRMVFHHRLNTPTPAVSPPPLADEAALLATASDTLSLWRFSADPKIFVAIFPSLHGQAMALNRVAAFIERPDVPRDHLLSDPALAAVTGHTATMFDTYYYGHDYRSADLRRFFGTADRDHFALNDPERALRAHLRDAGFFEPGEAKALITLPPHGDGIIDPSGRATILDHELSHGAYFTDPAYAAYVEAFWAGLTDPERTAFRQFLQGEGYDGGNDDLMRNETQAYLVFTADPRMFDPARIGVPEALDLRHTFLAALPVAWLRRDADPP